MFSKKLQANILAGVASLLMSSIAVGAAVLPADIAASPLSQVVYA